MADRMATLVLSGGGARGAFQVGAERVLREELGYQWERIFGVSVGALNGLMLAQQAYAQLLTVWNTIREKDVYDKSGWLVVAWRLAVQKKLGVYSNRALRNTIEKHAHYAPFKVPLYVGRVSLLSGAYEHVPNTAPDFLDAVWESATMPVVWESIGPQAWVDGGLRNVTPLGDALQHAPTEIVVILCHTDDPGPIEPPRDIVEVAQRSLTDITINEIMLGDVREFIRINNLVHQADEQGFTLKNEAGKPFKYCPITVIQPKAPLGDVLDFSQSAIQPRLKAGEAAARERFSAQ